MGYRGRQRVGAERYESHGGPWLATENGIAVLDGALGSGPIKSLVVTATPIHTQQPDARTATPGAEVSHGEGEISMSPEFWEF